MFKLRNGLLFFNSFNLVKDKHKILEKAVK